MSNRLRSAICAALVLLVSAGRLAAAPIEAFAPASIGSIDLHRRLDVNNLNLATTNAGSFAWIPPSGAGLVFPIGSRSTVMFAAGLWVGGLVAGEPRVTAAEYGWEYGPGRIVGGVADDPGRARYRTFKVVRWSGDPTDSAHVDRSADELAADPDLDSLAHHSWSEYVNGAGVDGAPIRIHRLPVTTTPQPGDSVDVVGPDVSGDQMLWSVYNDADAAHHVVGAGGTEPLGIEVRQTTSAMARDGFLGNVIFIRFQVVHRGSQTLDDAYVSIWSDPDVGDAADDLVGCDTTLGLAFAYNGMSFDAVYGSSPPAVGFVVLQGARDGSDDLGLSSFVRFVNGTDPQNPTESYRAMRGLLPDGAVQVDPTTGLATRFAYSGHAFGQTGWLDSSPGDRRCLLSTGPFTFAPGDVQDIVVALIVAGSNDRLASAELLRSWAEMLRASAPNRAAVVHARAQDDGVRIVWLLDASGTEAAVQRRSGTGPWVELDRRRSDTDRRIDFRDTGAGPGRNDYRLILDGGVTPAGEVSLDVPVAPPLSLAGLVPNPGADLDVSFTLARSSPARLELIDIAGRRWAVAEVGAMGAGRHLVRLSPGRRPPSGAYVLRLTQDGRVVVRKAAVL